MADPYSDFKVLTNVYVKKLWQTEWERYPENKLYKIQPKMDDPIPSHGRCRREEQYYADYILVTLFKLIFIF